MSVDELLDGDAVAIATAIRDGEVTAVEVVEAAAGRIEARDGEVNAVVSTRLDEAIAEARAGVAGPFAGVPFLVKDLGVEVAGLPHTRGSRLWADAVSVADSPLVERYRRAGLIILGKTNTPELGKNASTEPVLFGPTRNPHDHSRSPGGSSGGTAAAVAAGMVPAGHGNDAGGSIRIPAAACGLVGLKPSRGRTPGRESQGALSAPAAVDHVITRSVRDTAMLLDVEGGPLPNAGYAAAPPPSGTWADEVGRGPGRLRIALSTDRTDGIDTPDDVAAVARDAARRLEGLGHHVVEATPPWPMEAFWTAFTVAMRVPSVVDVDDRLVELGRELRDDDLEPMTRRMYDLGRENTGADMVRAIRAVERTALALGPFFTEHDLLVTPTLGAEVPEIGHLDTTDVEAMYERAYTYSAFTSIFNVTGQPAISLPMGTDRNGLPCGVQLTAAYGREDLLLRVAAQLEADGAW